MKFETLFEKSLITFFCIKLRCEKIYVKISYAYYYFLILKNDFLRKILQIIIWLLII